VIDHTLKMQRSQDVVQRLAAALRGAKLYSSGHPRVAEALQALLASLAELQALHSPVLLGFVGGEIIVDDMPLQKASAALADLVRRLESIGIQKVSIERGVTLDELTQFVHLVVTAPPAEKVADGDEDGELEIVSLPHLRAGRILVEPTSDGQGGTEGAATARRVYTRSVAAARTVWESAKVEGRPELPVARDTVENLADAVVRNRPAIVGLTAMQKHDNYTFTHMVNVSILTMGQARGLGVDGPLLREIGLAALMHDIGKVRTPLDVLNKPEKLTDQEFEIMKRHTTDGAEILRRTPEMPMLAPVVAFEHHLRLDGSGYPAGVRRESLGLATMLCSISDVYDAMRSQRKYQEAFPNERIVAVMKRNDGKQFDQHLVRRFVQLLGIYPVASLVRLSNGEVAVVTRIHAPDPVRPTVRVLIDPDGQRLPHPVDRDLWDAPRGEIAISAPLDAGSLGIDPLHYL
jgi:putative nucleotidyltransferase with HDIG domain